jgi:hypothetical protein
MRISKRYLKKRFPTDQKVKRFVDSARNRMGPYLVP